MMLGASQEEHDTGQQCDSSNRTELQPTALLQFYYNPYSVYEVFNSEFLLQAFHDYSPAGEHFMGCPIPHHCLYSGGWGWNSKGNGCSDIME